MSAVITSIANLKGGVGKSTTTLMIADGLAYHYGANVLVVDMDPQANASQMMLTERGLHHALDTGKGIHFVLKQFGAGGTPNVADLIHSNAVTLEELRAAEMRDNRQGWMSILASHPILRLTEMEIEDELYGRGCRPSELASMLSEHLSRALEPLLPIYDIVLIDTPPYLSPLARAGLSLSSQFITPTLADPVSIWGTKQFSDWMSDNIPAFSPERNFVVITRFKNTRMSSHAESELKNIYLPDRTFGPTIPESVQALQAMERSAVDSYSTMRGKYGGLRGSVKKLSESFVSFLSASNGAAAPDQIRN